MRKYFFGYLFVRIAKLLAALTVLAGMVLALFRLEQASLASQSATYQASASLRQRLDALTASLADASGKVAAFCEENGGAMPAIVPVELPGSLRRDDDFIRLSNALDLMGRQRVELKNTLVSHFDHLVESIQEKLRAHAAVVAPAAAPAVTTGTVTAPTPRPASTPSSQVETLYGGQMGNYEIRQRTAVLNQGKELLKVLETSAENPANRKVLTDSVAQLDALSHLLPSPVETPVDTEPPTRSTGITTPDAPPRRELNAEKVAAQLARLRGTVREVVLTSWKVDTDYTQALDLNTSEGERCRIAALNVKGIWLGAFGQLAVALVAAVFAAFLILVLADFMQTLLDTATNTGKMADAIQP